MSDIPSIRILNLPRTHESLTGFIPVDDNTLGSGKLPLTLVSEAINSAALTEKRSRRLADLARWPWVDFAATKYAAISSMQYLTAPLTFCFAYDMPVAPTGMLVFFSDFNYIINTGGSSSLSLYGATLYLDVANNRVCFAVGDGGSINSNGRSDAIWSGISTYFPSGKHTVCVRLLDSWRNSTTGVISAELFIDGVSQGLGWNNYGSASTFNYSLRGANAPLPVKIGCSSFYYTASAASSAKCAISRFHIFNAYLPASKALDTGALGYSIEQYDAGEPPPSTLAPILRLDTRQGSQWRDASPNLTHAVIEGAPPLLEAPAVMVNKLTWNADGTAKAFLSSVNNVIPANCKITVSAKSNVDATIDVTDGAASPTTLIAGVSLAAGTWTTVGTAFVSAACKLAIDPTSAITGSISVQVKIEPLV